nr:MAG: replication-associated protein [Rhinopithecus-associated circovirus 2]
MSNPNPEAKRWCFTLNNPLIDEQEVLNQLETLAMEYTVFQLEQGAEETPHFQGFVCFEKKQRLSAIRHLFPAHFTVARGTVAQNRKYCTKEEGRIGEFIEAGVPPKEKGTRTDLEDLHSRLQSGLTLKEYSNEFFSLFVKYPKLVENYELAQLEGRPEGCEVNVTLLIGDGGTGKSRLASKLARDLGYGIPYRHSLGQWWDGYRGERAVVFDDFRGSSLSITQYKLIFDRYPLRVAVKGTSCNLGATDFFITSNVNPLDWWRDDITSREHHAITRRITRILYFEEFGKYYEFDSYEHFASLILTPLRDGIFRPALPPVQEIVYD